MIFEWSRESKAWELLADTGELLGRAWPVGDGCFQAETTDLLGNYVATGTSLGVIQNWMLNLAAGIKP